MAGVNRMLAPADGLTIRRPTDAGLEKGNIQNPPRYEDWGIGGLDGPGAKGLEATPFGQTSVGDTIRKMPNIKGSKD